MRRTGAGLGAAILLLTALALDHAALSEERNAGTHAIVNAETIQTRVFLVFDKRSRKIARKVYSVWNPAPEQGLDFDWTSDRPSLDEPELVTGRGQLIWRLRGTASYDKHAIVSRYRGEMKDGRPSGRGELRTRDGHRYEGEWRLGRYDGQGALQMPDGASYEGAFKAGRFHGQGTLVQADNEMFVGPFVNGMKHGSGKTRLPSGATYLSSWSNGIEDADSKTVRLAQAGETGPTVPASETLRIALQVEQVEDSMGYVAETKADRVAIVPDDEQLRAAWKASGPMLEAVDYEDLGDRRGENDTGVLFLNVAFNNTGTKAIDIVRSTVEVTESVTDKQPLYGLANPGPFACKDGEHHDAIFNTELIFKNFGWSEPSAVKMEVAFSDLEHADLAKPDTIKTRVFSIDLPATAKNLRYDAGLLFTQLGVNVADFKARQSRMGPSRQDLRRLSGAALEAAKKKDAFDCSGLTDKDCKTKLVGAGALGGLANAVMMDQGTIITLAAGRLTYRYKDAKGADRSYVAPFESVLSLGARSVPNCSEGGDGPQIDPGAVVRVPLTLDQANYHVALPLKGSIAAGKSRSLRLALRSAKSSEHRFRIVVLTKDAQLVRSKQVDLLAFMPKIEGAR